MSEAASTDHGTVLERGQWALVFDPKTKRHSLYTPAPSGTNVVVPEEALALTAVFIRLDSDPEFREELLRWFHAQTGN